MERKKHMLKKFCSTWIRVYTLYHISGRRCNTFAIVIRFKRQKKMLSFLLSIFRRDIIVVHASHLKIAATRDTEIIFCRSDQVYIFFHRCDSIWVCENVPADFSQITQSRSNQRQPHEKDIVISVHSNDHNCSLIDTTEFTANGDIVTSVSALRTFRWQASRERTCVLTEVWRQPNEERFSLFVLSLSISRLLSTFPHSNQYIHTIQSTAKTNPFGKAKL